MIPARLNRVYVGPPKHYRPFFMSLSPPVQLALGIAAVVGFAVAVARWYTTQPKTSREWLEQEEPEDPYDRPQWAERRAQKAVLTALLLTSGLVLIADACADMGS